jgi:hypothetical protein
VTVADGGAGVRSLLLAGAPCSLGSSWGPVSIRAGAAKQQGGVRSGCFLTSAPCSSVAAVVKWSRHGSGHSGDDGVPTEVTTTGSRWWQRVLQSLPLRSGSGSVQGK